MSSIPSAGTGHHQFIPLGKLSASPLNHRKTFDKVKMEELTESVRSKGILQPILARPIGEAFEVVAGERRFRAAKAAKLVDIPAIVRELNDTEALEIQVIENGQRVDPHPLEEAEGYEALLACKDSKGEPYTVEQIAAKVGKGKGFVYGRLKLCALGKNARKAFYDGHLDASRALLIARIPVPELQDEALEEICGGEGGDEFDEATGRYRMSYREAARHVHDHYMLQLKSAPFKTGDADLLPAVGACTTCPKRTGNQPELFGDVKNADVCTDPKCFAAKKEAHGAKLRAAAEASGKKVITGAEAKKLMPSQYAEEPTGYMHLAKTVWIGDKQKSVKQLLGKDCPETVLIENPHSGELMECVPAAAARPIINAALPKEDRHQASGNDDYRKQQKAREEKAKRETKFRERIHAKLRAMVVKDSDLTLEESRASALAHFQDIWHEHRDRLARLWIADVPAPAKAKKSGNSPKHDRIDDFEKMIANMTEHALATFRLDLAVIKDSYVRPYNSDKPDALFALAKARKINVDKERAAYDAEVKAATKEKKAKKAKK